MTAELIESKKEKENRQQEYKEICPKDSNSVGSAQLLWKCSREYVHPPPSVSQLRNCEVTSIHQLLC